MQRPPVGSAATAAFLASKGTYLRYLSHFFFSPLLETLGESPQRVGRVSPEDARHLRKKKKMGEVFGGGVYRRNRKTNGGHREITRTRMKGRLCDARVTGIRANNRASTPTLPRARVTRKLPGNGDTATCAALSVLRAFLPFPLFYFFFLVRGLINLVLRLIV